MEQVVELSVVSFGRFAYRFTPDVVQALLPDSVVGTYLLIKHGLPVYVGRSDTCLRTRLGRHPWLGIATHFTWEPCRTSFQAFCLESLWYHRLVGEPETLNRVHPARPSNCRRPCPFCVTRDLEAWQVAVHLYLAASAVTG